MISKEMQMIFGQLLVSFADIDSTWQIPFACTDYSEQRMTQSDSLARLPD